MGLQLRLTHSLGDRLIDVEARSADRPVVVGRASNAEVPVPSANIAKSHCLLFVHEGRWVVQDGGSPTGTYLNGEAVGDPAYVSSGDVIQLGTGSNPPTITVDPHGVGVVEDDGQGAHAAGAPPQGGYVPQQAAYAPPPPMPAPARSSGGMFDDPEADPDDNIFGAPAAPAAPSVPGYGAPRPGYGGAPAPGYPAPGYGQPAAQAESGWEGVKPTKKYYVPKRQGTSSATIGVVAVVSVFIVVGGGYWVYTAYQAQLESAKPKIIQLPPSKQEAPVAKPSGIFDPNSFQKKPEKSGTTGTPTKPGARGVPVTGAGGEGEMASASTPPKVAGTSPASKPVAAAEREQPPDEMPADPDIAAAMSEWRGTPALSIVRLIDYRELNGEKNKADVEKGIETCLDHLWWTRIKELFDARDKNEQEIARLKLDMATSQDAAFKQSLQKDVDKFTTRRDKAVSVMKDDMKYDRDKPPELFDEYELRTLRKVRDEATYAEWKRVVTASIKRTKGKLPWRPLD
jgi:hypothetical protein